MVVVSCLVSWISTMREPKRQNRNSAGGLSSRVRGPWELVFPTGAGSKGSLRIGTRRKPRSLGHLTAAPESRGPSRGIQFHPLCLQLSGSPERCSKCSLRCCAGSVLGAEMPANLKWGLLEALGRRSVAHRAWGSAASPTSSRTAQFCSVLDIGIGLKLEFGNTIALLKEM